MVMRLVMGILCCAGVFFHGVPDRGSFFAEKGFVWQLL
jgi:hypothetical protein